MCLPIWALSRATKPRRATLRALLMTQPFAGLAFKIMNDPFVGSLTFVRIYSGVMTKGGSMLNSTKDKQERIGRMMMMHSNNREEIEEAYAGDIIALAGLKQTTTGDTLCAKNDPVVLETMTFPDPVIEIAVEPKSKADQEKMSVGLQRLAAEDPSFQVESDFESGQTIMKGMGELHLDILVDRLKREFKVEANIGQPKVAYREALGRVADIDYTHKKQSGGSGQFARVKLTFEPLGSQVLALSSKARLSAVTCRRNTFLGVENGLKMAKENGLSGRLSCDRLQSDADRWRVSTMSTQASWRLKSPRARPSVS